MIDAKLTTFINLAKLRNYTRTAELLNLTQPAVSQHIRQLEDYYGVQLVKKKGRQLNLTGEGELLLKYANELETKDLNFQRTLMNKSAVVKRYNLGATLTIGEFVLPWLLGEHKRRFESVDIIMHVHNLEDILERLNLGQFDLGIVEGPFDKTRFKYKKFKEDELVLAVSPKSHLAKMEEIELADIVGMGRLILRENGSGTRSVFENKLLELGIGLQQVKIYMEVGSIGAIKSLVQADLGYTVISREAVRQEVAAGTLKTVPLKGVRILREFNFVYLDYGQEAFINGFIEFLTGAILNN
ncbi:HTH-type transcriptional regulator CysL [Ruminiclostridium hungatei]|uniref:HTH-type transcriptional regulator CysL n=1 Tax=Ruminiclostridium hungatei TaxID=48256 RepID=A0A1V4SIG6_RUMHU|nr:LysR family transcriptional regulator [Ruminiclostridium hungatei]OPX43296.1 HTH-type transcriptional regulator CysL [Ruminiclostridium hungatei]